MPEANVSFMTNMKRFRKEGLLVFLCDGWKDVGEASGRQDGKVWDVVGAKPYRNG